MKIKLFTHIDLDGYSCDILLRLCTSIESLDTKYCDYKNINEEVTDFINSGAYKEYDYILITDISVNEETAELIDKTIAGNKNVLLLDHHKTALFLNKYYKWAKVLIEDTHEKVCGTSMLYKFLKAWRWIYPTSAIDKYVEKVKRYDTWLWKEKYNDLEAYELNNLFNIYGPKNFSSLFIDRLSIGEFINDTDKILLDIKESKVNNQILKLNKTIITKDIVINDTSYKAGVVFADNDISITGNRLAEMHPELDFIAIISGMNNISYRTIKDNVPLDIIAKHFGGGGHPKAAGSQISLALKNNIIDSIFSL